MQIFKIIQLADGGPNDKGTVIGFDIAESKKELHEKYKNNFLEFYIISKKEYLKLKQDAINTLNMFNLDLKRHIQ